MGDLGTDFAGVDDLDYGLTIVSDRRCLLEAVMRRWMISPGSLFYAPTYGGGLIDRVNGETLPGGILASRLESQALEDERVSACEVDVLHIGYTLRIRGVIGDADGPFEFTVDISFGAKTEPVAQPSPTAGEELAAGYGPGSRATSIAGTFAISINGEFVSSGAF